MKKRLLGVGMVLVLLLGLYAGAMGTFYGNKSQKEPKTTAVTEKETTEVTKEAKTNDAKTKLEKTKGVLLTAAKTGKGGIEKGSFAFTKVVAGKDVASEFFKKGQVYSPLTLSMAVAMLADASSGETRKEIIEKMGWSSMEELRKMVKTAYGAANQKKDEGESIVANSLWLRDDGTYHKRKLEELAEDFYADTFSGKMGSEEYDKLHQEWLNEKTRGLLEDIVKDEKFGEALQMCLSSATYFHEQWPESMYVVKNQYFSGEEADMLGTSQNMEYYRVDHYRSIGLPLRNGTIFWLFLPDSGYGIDEILKDNRYLSIMQGKIEPEQENVEVVVRFPKMDESAKVDGKAALEKLGISRPLDARADFSELSDEEMRLTGIPHATRIKVDEYGITAAAFAEDTLEGACMPEHIEYFICNRPFLYAVADGDGMVYFEGAKKSGDSQISYEKGMRNAVRVNGKVYLETNVKSKVTCGVADGMIYDSCEAGTTPNEDGTANFGLGYRYQYAEEGCLSVEIDGCWHLFAEEGVEFDGHEE